MDFTIDKGIAPPTKKARSSELSKKVGAMRIKDSVWCDTREKATAIYNAICRVFFGSDSGQMARVDETDRRGEGFRVWRVK